jgi:hypothetical protein
VPGPWRRRNRTVDRSLEARRRARRLQADAALVAVHYPGLRLERISDGDAFVGQLTIGSSSGLNTHLDVRIELPRGYPDVEPVAFDAAGRFPRKDDAHIYADGSCCLWLPWDSAWNPRDAAGIIAFIDHVVEFLYKQLVFEANGHTKWPGAARSHGRLGFAEFVCEALSIDRSLLPRFLSVLADWRGYDRYQLCPCGAKAKFRWCHEQAVVSLLSRVGRRRVEAHVRACLGEPIAPNSPAVTPIRPAQGSTATASVEAKREEAV